MAVAIMVTKYLEHTKATAQAATVTHTKVFRRGMRSRNYTGSHIRAERWNRPASMISSTICMGFLLSIAS